MDKELTLRACTLLAQAYAFAKDGNEAVAGKLLVQAAEDDGLDEVMDGVAQAATAMESDDDDDFEELPTDLDEVEEEEPEEDESEDTEPAEVTAAEVTANVQIPESVARLAARALV